MPELQAQRRLVKSPPELWAEVSDAASLARHLGEVGEITITRAEPESTVAWEGEHASGTVELEPAGWGTRVTLTAQPAGAAAASPAQPAAEAAEAPAADSGPKPVPEPDPVPDPPKPVPEPDPVPPPAAIEPLAPAPDPAPVPTSFLRRLLRRRAAAAVAPATEVAPVAQPALAREPARESTPPAPATPEPAAPGAGPVPEPADDALQAVLTAALDSLGAAHHRPFSRG
jgi:hypothetical protein